MGPNAADHKLPMTGSTIIGCSLLLWHQTSDAEFPCATCVVLVQQEMLARRDYSDVRACGMDYKDSDAQSEAMCVLARQIQGKIWNKKGLEGKKSLYLKVKRREFTRTSQI